MPVVSYYNHQLQQHRLSHPSLSSRSQRHPSLRLTQGCRAAPPPENIRFGACLLQEELRGGHGLLLGDDIGGLPNLPCFRSSARRATRQHQPCCCSCGPRTGIYAKCHTFSMHEAETYSWSSSACTAPRTSRLSCCSTRSACSLPCSTVTYAGAEGVEDPPGPWRWRRRARATDSERRRHARSNNGRKQLGQ
jgi:hypothetical protein